MPDRPGMRRAYRFKSQWRRSQRQAVLKRFGSRCALCGRPGSDGKGKGLTQAHVVPHSQGGKDDARSVVLLCRVCHARFDSQRSA